MCSKKTLMQQLLDAGYPEDQMYNHNSDLYVFVTPLSRKIVSYWCNSNGFRRDWHCPIFKDSITGKDMFDCAFAYDPFWQSREE